MGKKEMTPEEQAEQIKALKAEGKGHAEICTDHPELSDGWDVLTTDAVATRPPRGGGSIDRPDHTSPRPC